MTPTEDFTDAPTSRRAPRPEQVGMTPRERQEADARRLVGEPKWEPPAPCWAPGRRSDPEVLRLLDYPHCPVTGMPLQPGAFEEPAPPPPSAPDQERAGWMARRDRLWREHQAGLDEYRARFAFWASLDSCAKTQLGFDAEDRGKEGPEWLVSVPADPAQPPVILAAADAHEARQRYKVKNGIIVVVPRAEAGYGEPVEVVAYLPPLPSCNGHAEAETP
jgi:hypothetical protein